MNIHERKEEKYKIKTKILRLPSWETRQSKTKVSRKKSNNIRKDSNGIEKQEERLDKAKVKISIKLKASGQAN